MRQAGWLYRQACSVQGRERLWVKGRALGQKLQLSLGYFKGLAPVRLSQSEITATTGCPGDGNPVRFAGTKCVANLITP